MRVEFINELGGIMSVDESRVDEYKEAGYKLASDSLKTPAEKTKPVPRRKSNKEV